MDDTTDTTKPTEILLSGPVIDCNRCGGKVLVVDEPVIPSEPCKTRLGLPTAKMILRAMEVSNAAAKDSPELVKLVALLTDAYMLQRELLARFVDYGVFGIHGEEEDGRRFEQTLDIATDIFAIGLTPGEDGLPAEIDIDLGCVRDEIAEYAQEADKSAADEPVPTPFEA